MDAYKYSNRKKLWLCGITQDRLEDIDEMLSPEVLEVVDGVNFTDGYSKDGTYELLQERKGEGEISQRKWTNDHDFQMNEFLRCGTMQNGDWFLILDSPERLTDHWLSNIRKDIEGYEEKNIGAIAMSGRAYLAKYFDNMFFFPSPHWGLQNIVGQPEGISDEDKPKYIINKRDEDPKESYLLHPSKYYYVYGRSNHTSLMYGPFGEGAVGYHENIRLRFRLYCNNVLGLDYSMESLEEYLRKKDFTEEFIEVAELEYSIKDVFRLKVLDQTFEEINDNRYNWSLKKYLETGEVNQSKSDYIGIVNEYRKEAGMKPEEPAHVYEKLST
tara:strand:- start:184 stop:1167 length:984 start_codon:yes stop_codon:yes gene_type:complete